MSTGWKLIIEDDAGKQIVVPFSRDVITVGRKEGNTIRLTERNVSRFHAKLEREADRIVVEDLGSFNGIKLNGDRISGRVALSEGDTIEIGDYQLGLHMVSKSEVPPPRMSTLADADSDDEFSGDTQRWDPPAPQDVTAQGNVGLADAPEGNAKTLDLVPRAAQMAPVLAPATARTADMPMPALGHSPPNSVDVTERDRAAPGSSAGGSMPAPNDLHVAETRPERVAPRPGDVVATASVPPIMTGPTAKAPVVPSSKGPPAGETSPKGPPEGQTSPKGNPDGYHANAATLALTPAPSQDISTPRLVVINTAFCGSVFAVSAAEAVIGRTADNDIQIEHRSVSRNHAKLVREGERVRVLDLKSANGILINNEEVDTAILKSGDVLELGRVKLRFAAVGELFVMSPEDIERARAAEAAGDEFEGDSATGLVRSLPNGLMADELAFKRNNRVLIAAIGGLVLVSIVAIVMLLRGGSEEEAAEAPAVAAAAKAGADDEEKPPSATPESAPAESERPEPVRPEPARADAPVAVQAQPDAPVVDAVEPVVEEEPRKAERNPEARERRERKKRVPTIDAVRGVIAQDPAKAASMANDLIRSSQASERDRRDAEVLKTMACNRLPKGTRDCR